jgi:hypothetical protein
MKKIVQIALVLLIIPMIAFANKPHQITGNWYSPKLDKALFIDQSHDALVVDFNKRNHRFDKMIFYRVSRNKFKAKNGSYIKVLNKDRIKFYDQIRRNSVLLVKRNNRRDRHNHYYQNNNGNYQYNDNGNNYNEYAHLNSYEGRWYSDKIDRRLLLEVQRGDLLIKLEGERDWIVYNRERNGLYVNNRGDTLELENDRIIWKDKKGRNKMVWKKA